MESSSSSSSPGRRLNPLPLGLLLSLQLLQYPLASYSYSWTFKEQPRQCGNVTVNIIGTGGKPPYRMVVIPFGPTPLGKEVRTILDIPFDDNATSLTFKLKFPANSQLVAVVSDAAGFGTGGTSVAARVQDSDDDSCYDATQNSQVAFSFDISPRGQITQCGDIRLFWQNKNQTQPPVQFYGVIPGGQAFTIPTGEITDVQTLGTGFSWKTNVRSETTLMLVAGDARGIGVGGSATYLVGNNINEDSSCINSTSPSSTAGLPAGGSYPTGTGSDSGDSTDPVDGGSGGTNVGAIVGGVIGGLVVLVSAFLLFYRRRQKSRARQREKPVDLLNEDEDGDGHNRESRNDLPQFYQPEPFTVPDPTLASTYGDGTDDNSTRPLSGTATSFYTRSGTPDGSVALGYGGGIPPASSVGTGRKGQPPRMRPVNIIQHDDAGPSVPYQPKEEEEPETIELPPAYTAINSQASVPQQPPPPPPPPTSQQQQ